MKKEKMKYYVKKNLISFVIGLIIFGSLGVYAVVTFNSQDVSYSNKTSGLSSNNVQGAIDELYEKCTAVPTPGDTILDSVDIVSSGDGLYAADEEGRYFYKGKNVNNYVTFNNETWRIISIEPDKTIKIMRWESIGNQVWDSSNSNNWTRPASLNTYLNGTYLNSMTSTAQSQIASKEWSIGAVTYNDTSLSSSIADENGVTWNGKVALPTASEYIRSNSNQSSCGNMDQVYSSTTCDDTSWMHNNADWWMLSPLAGYSSGVFFVLSHGNVYFRNAKYTDGVHPVVYLSSEVQITGGSGISSDPYQLM